MLAIVYTSAGFKPNLAALAVRFPSQNFWCWSVSLSNIFLKDPFHQKRYELGITSVITVFVSTWYGASESLFEMKLITSSESASKLAPIFPAKSSFVRSLLMTSLTGDWFPAFSILTNFTRLLPFFISYLPALTARLYLICLANLSKKKLFPMIF